MTEKPLYRVRDNDFEIVVYDSSQGPYVKIDYDGGEQALVLDREQVGALIELLKDIRVFLMMERF